MTASWQFPPNEAGELEGPNDPSVAHFTGKRSASIVREVIQNSLDARANEKFPVRVEFRTVELRKELFAAEQLCVALEQAIEKLQRYDKRNMAAFQKGLQQLRGARGSVSCLQITDSNTKGAAFSHPPPNNSGLKQQNEWQALVKGAGANIKSNDGAAGSFGVGKGAPFTITPLRTVLYATAVRDAVSGRLRRCYQGKTILVDHVDGAGIARRGTGYFGAAEYNPFIEGDFRPIPKEFSLPEPGLRIHIPCAEFVRERERIVDVIENFFFAIVHKQLEVHVEDQRIDDLQLEKYHDYLREMNKWQVLRFIQVARLEPIAETHIAGIGRVKLRLRKKHPDEGRRREIALVRDAGMVISSKWGDIRDGLKFKSLPQHWHPFTAIVECLSGGKPSYLRDAESPRHDQISLEQIGDEKRRQQAFKAFKEVSDWVYEELRKQVDRDISELAMEEIEELREFFPVKDAEGFPEEWPNGSEKDDFVSMPAQTFSRGLRRFRSPSPVSPSPRRPRDPSDSPIPRPSRPANVETHRFRFRPNAQNDSHAIVVSFSPRRDCERLREIGLFTVGEDGRAYPVGLRQARAKGQDLPLAVNVVSELPVTPGERVTLELSTREPTQNKTFRLVFKED